MTKDDFDYVVRVIDNWWGGPTSALAHPVFFYEWGCWAQVAEHQDRVVGFLFGFVTRERPVGYVHLVGIDPAYRRRGVGTELYRSFEQACRQAHCQELKAITTLANDASVRFHQVQGWSHERVPDYAGPGRDRIVFRKQLEG